MPSPPLAAGPILEADAISAVRRSVVLDGCKWDPQVGDRATLAPFPLLLSAAAWTELRTLAGKLAREVLAAEAALLTRPDLHPLLAVPPPIRRLLRREVPAPSGDTRLLRFDFHPTPDGWRVSEVNSDAPAGFSEASCFTRLMAAHYPGTSPAGDPAARWVDAIAGAAAGSGRVALVSAPGFMEDHQLVGYLARLLRCRGLDTLLGSPEQLRWHDGQAHLLGREKDGPLGAVVRYYQAEWLPRLPRRSGWAHFFRGGRTPVLNAGSAILTESKRFPLSWPHLQVPLPTFQALLPETRDPLQAPWQDDGWLLKAAYGNAGDGVVVREYHEGPRWRQAVRALMRHPGAWVAQRRFAVQPLGTPHGPRYPCIGVYTLGHEVTGVYGRIAEGPVIDQAATDIAVLVRGECP